MISLFTIFDATGTASTVAYIGEVFTDVKLLIYLAIGIPLAFYVIRKVAKLLPRG